MKRAHADFACERVEPDARRRIGIKTLLRIANASCMVLERARPASADGGRPHLWDIAPQCGRAGLRKHGAIHIQCMAKPPIQIAQPIVGQQHGRLRATPSAPATICAPVFASVAHRQADIAQIAIVMRDPKPHARMNQQDISCHEPPTAAIDFNIETPGLHDARAEARAGLFGRALIVVARSVSKRQTSTSAVNQRGVRRLIWVHVTTRARGRMAPS